MAAPSSVRTAIFNLLQADAALLAMVGGPERVFHRNAPQDADATEPFVIIHKQSGRPEYTFGDWHDDELWTVKGVVRGTNSTKAERVDIRLRELLHDANLIITDYETLYCRREEDVDFGEMEEGAVVHHVGAMYRIYKQPTA